MNKLIYAIGIAVATTFATTNKAHTTKVKEVETVKTEQIKAIPEISESDSLTVEAH